MGKLPAGVKTRNHGSKNHLQKSKDDKRKAVYRPGRMCFMPGLVRLGEADRKGNRKNQKNGLQVL